MTRPSRPTVLVVESEEHYFLCGSTLELLGPVAEVRFLLGRGLSPGNRATKDWRVMFPDRADGSGVTLARHRTILLRALLVSRRDDLVLVQTGPDFGPLVKVLGFWLLCRLRGRRVVVVLHGIRPYLPRGRRTADRLRAASLQHVRGVVFESEALRRGFLAAMGSRPTPPTAVVPVRYARPRGERVPPPARSGSERLRIGLVGGVTRKRRDYDAVREALARLDPAARSGLELVTLGNCTKQRCHDIMGGLAELVDVDVVPRHLTEAEFIARGTSCHVLLAPLVAGLRYGRSQGSGAFGDAVRLGRRLIVPAEADPLGEHAGLTLPYHDVDGLAERLREVLSTVPSPDDEALDRATAAAVRRRLVDDLGPGPLLGPSPGTP